MISPTSGTDITHLLLKCNSDTENKNKTDQYRHNKALHPTAYSLRFGRKLLSLRLSAAGELGR